MTNLSLHPLAVRELLLAINWYRARSGLAEQRYREAVDQALSRIETNPHQGTPFRKHYLWVKTRRYPYLIYYRHVERNDWIVLAIAHQRRRPGYWLKRR